MYLLPEANAFERVMYDNDNLLVSNCLVDRVDNKSIGNLIPNHANCRIYPEWSDFQFCDTLLKLGVVQRFQFSDTSFDFDHPGARVALRRGDLPRRDIQYRLCSVPTVWHHDLGLDQDSMLVYEKVQEHLLHCATSLVGLYLDCQSSEADERMAQVPDVVTNLVQVLMAETHGPAYKARVDGNAVMQKVKEAVAHKVHALRQREGVLAQFPRGQMATRPKN